MKHGAEAWVYPNSDAVDNGGTRCTESNKSIERYASSHDKHCGGKLLHIRLNAGYRFCHRKKNDRQEGRGGGLPAGSGNVEGKTDSCPASARV